MKRQETTREASKMEVTVDNKPMSDISDRLVRVGPEEGF